MPTASHRPSLYAGHDDVLRAFPTVTMTCAGSSWRTMPSASCRPSPDPPENRHRSRSSHRSPQLHSDRALTPWRTVPPTLASDPSNVGDRHVVTAQNAGTEARKRHRRSLPCRDGKELPTAATRDLHRRAILRSAGPDGSPHDYRRTRLAPTAAARDGRTIVRSGRKNGSAGGRTKEWLDTGGQHPVKSERLIPSSHLSTEPGQVQSSA